jgi:peptidoglycan/xylan/chitin deacetylase (PgdA/CDA1 family)
MTHGRSLPRARGLGEPQIENRKSKIPILAYHKIRPARPDERRPSLVVEPEALAAHVAALRHWDYRLTTLRDLADVAGWRKAEEESRTRTSTRTRTIEKSAILTFDDGFACLHEHALPILAREGAPAVIFLVSGRIGGYNDFPGNRDPSRERLLDAGQIRELAAAGIEVGSHTVSHCNLTALDDAGLRAELADSKAAIEDLTGRPVLSLAYPYGYFDDRVVAAARDAGYCYACTARRGLCLSSSFSSSSSNPRPSSQEASRTTTRTITSTIEAADPLCLRRVAMGSRVGVWRLRYRLSPLYEWEHAWKERRASRRRN